MSRLTGFVVVPLAISLIFVSALGIWLQLTVLSQDTFAQSVSHAMTQESSRDAIASAVVDRLLRDRPLIQVAVRNPAESAISGVLGSSLFSTSVETMSKAAWREVFVRGGAGIVLDLTPAKRLLTGIFALVDSNQTASIDPANVADQLTIFPDGQLPDLRWLYDWAPVVTWISGIAGLAIAGIVGWRAGTNERRARLLSVSGVVLAIEAAGTLLLTLMVRMLLLRQVENESGKTIMRELLLSFFRSLSAELLLLTLAGLVLYAAARWILGASVVFEPGARGTTPEPADGSLSAPDRNLRLPS